MADIKNKDSMEKPKSKPTGFLPKEAKNIIKEKYAQQQEEKSPQKKGPVRYATDHVEDTGKRAAKATANAAKKIVQTKIQHKKQQSARTSKASSSPTPQEGNVPELPQVPSSEELHDVSPKELPTGASDTPYRASLTETQQINKPASLSDHTAPRTECNPSAVSKGEGRKHAFLSGKRPKISTESTELSTIYRGDKDRTTQYHGNLRRELRRKKVIENAKGRQQENARQNSLPVRDLSNLNADIPPQQASRTAAPTVKRNGMSLPKGKSSNKVTKSTRAAVNQPKFGNKLPKKTFSIKKGNVLSNTFKPNQRMKSAVQKKAQKEMAKQVAIRARQAAAKMGKLTMRMAQALGRAAIAMVQSLLAALGGTTMLMMLVCVILIAAIAASPFGILFSGESSANGVPVSVAVAEIQYRYNEALEELQTAEAYDDITIEGAGPDWVEVLAVFAVKVAGSNSVDATDVVVLDENRIDRLEAVFWDMTTITHTAQEVEGEDGTTVHNLHITISSLTAEEAAALYGFTEQQLDMLSDLLAERSLLEELVGCLFQMPTDAKEVLENLPEDLSPERKEVVKAACSLVGKVNYFWGGKSLVLGWDSRWGQLTEVTAAGSSTTGTYRPYGLDCSGFVDWVFYNATDGAYIIGHGGGAMAQHGYCTPVTWATAQIGDLAFYPGDTHVGVVCGWDESGNILILHCASGYNNVVITGQEGFVTVGRPTYYGGE